MDTTLIETAPGLADAELSRLDAGLHSEQPQVALNTLLHHLRALKHSCEPSAWQDVVGALRAHPIHRTILQSPLTGRAFHKPRGYAGDAVLLDVIYGTGPHPASGTAVGRAVYACEFESHACRVTRARKARLAREIDRAAGRHGQASVLSLACGHLREVALSEAARDGRAHVTAIDQDADSVAVVARDYAGVGVSAQVGSVGEAVRGRFSERAFHLVYAAGLYDYLDRRLATVLTRSLFHGLAPGGHLLLVNFTPDFLDIAYLDACQDWHLIYRDEAQMRALLESVPEGEVAAVEQFREHEDAITYLRVTRR
ncbi:MAG: methyltransferase type 12 [Vicinamibacterales bacterium]